MPLIKLIDADKEKIFTLWRARSGGSKEDLYQEFKKFIDGCVKEPENFVELLEASHPASVEFNKAVIRRILEKTDYFALPSDPVEQRNRLVNFYKENVQKRYPEIDLTPFLSPEWLERLGQKAPSAKAAPGGGGADPSREDEIRLAIVKIFDSFRIEGESLDPDMKQQQFENRLIRFKDKMGEQFPGVDFIPYLPTEVKYSKWVEKLRADAPRPTAEHRGGGGSGGSLSLEQEIEERIKVNLPEFVSRAAGNVKILSILVGGALEGLGRPITVEQIWKDPKAAKYFQDEPLKSAMILLLAKFLFDEKNKDRLFPRESKPNECKSTMEAILGSFNISWNEFKMTTLEHMPTEVGQFNSGRFARAFATPAAGARVPPPHPPGGGGGGGAGAGARRADVPPPRPGPSGGSGAAGGGAGRADDFKARYQAVKEDNPRVSALEKVLKDLAVKVKYDSAGSKDEYLESLRKRASEDANRTPPKSALAACGIVEGDTPETMRLRANEFIKANHPDKVAVRHTVGVKNIELARWLKENSKTEGALQYYQKAYELEALKAEIKGAASAPPYRAAM